MPLRPRANKKIALDGAQSSRRSALCRLGAVTGLTAIGGISPLSALLGGCGGAGGDTPASPPPSPRLGVHSLVYSLDLKGIPTTNLLISTAPRNTQALGSTILACVGRGVLVNPNLAPPDNPTDNKGNAPYARLGSLGSYGNLWPGSGTALYGCTSAVGGNGHVVTTTNPLNDEVTLAVVEVMNGGAIQDFKWTYVPSAPLITSLSVTTTGPATLVAFWWGDAGVGPHTAIPDSGFTVIDAILDVGGLVQCAVATKDVSIAGTHNVSWAATPLQGAQLWLAAVQKAP